MSLAESHTGESVVVIGAGPAGLTAAHRLSARGYHVTVVEKDPIYVGGISKTVKYNGFHFDIGGHRFFSKSQEVEDYWQEVLGDDFLDRPRKSRSGESVVVIGAGPAGLTAAHRLSARGFQVTVVEKA